MEEGVETKCASKSPDSIVEGLCSNILPTRVNLQQRKVQVNPRCAGQSYILQWGGGIPLPPPPLPPKMLKNLS